MADKQSRFSRFRENANDQESLVDSDRPEGQSRFSQFRQAPQGSIHPSVFAGERFVDAFLGAPAGTGDALAFLAGGASGLAHGLIPGGEGFDFGRRIEEQQEVGPASLLRQIPRPKIGEIAAGTRALFGEGEFTEDFGREMAEQDVMRMNTERESPFASTMYQLVGDAAALGVGRAPMLNRISNFEDWLMVAGKAVEPDLVFSTAQLAKAPATIRGSISNYLRNSEVIRRTARAAGRSVEAGLEATALDIINGNDPGEMFGYAAGLQLVNSGMIEGMDTIFKGKGSATTKLAAATFVGAALWQQLQIATPIDDNFLNAMTASGEKVFFGLALGAAAKLAGGGRLRGSTDEMSKPAQMALDAFSQVPRSTVTGLVRQMRDADPEDKQAADDLMALVAWNPAAIKPGEAARIGSAMEMGTLPDTATVMMRDKQFVERMLRFEEPDDLVNTANLPWQIDGP